MADMFHLADNTKFGPRNVFLFIFGIIFQCIKIDGTNQLQSPAFIENVKYLVILGSWVCLVTQSCPSLCNPMDSRQEYWSGLPFPPPGDLPNPRIKPTSLCLLHWQVDSLPLVPVTLLLGFLDWHCQVEITALIEMFLCRTVQCSIHCPHVAV